MVAGKYNLTGDGRIEQGATFTFTTTHYSDEAKTIPIDLSGYEIRMMIRTFKEASAILESFSTVDGNIAISGADNNVVTVTATATETAAYTFYSGVYDMEFESPSGIVTRILEGSVEVSFEVTR